MLGKTTGRTTQDHAEIAEIQRVIVALNTAPVVPEMANSLLQTLAWQVFALLAEARETRARVDQLLAEMAERDRIAAAGVAAPQVDTVLAQG